MQISQLGESLVVNRVFCSFRKNMRLDRLIITNAFSLQKGAITVIGPSHLKEACIDTIDKGIAIRVG